MTRRKGRSFLTTSRNFMCLVVLVLLIMVYKMNKMHRFEILSQIPENCLKYINFTPKKDLEPLVRGEVTAIISLYNSEHRIANDDIFEPFKSDAPIFVVYVDKYKVNLKFFLVSLSQVLGIDEALIIFSHLSFDENVNKLIETIDFARVQQIFYPYSLELYPNEFPGFQKGDCPYNMDIFTAQSINCTGADTPDIHGRYRDPLKSQMKHYWWWTLNQVFEHIPHTKDHKGIFTFLEDDLFLVEDFIYMTSHMHKLSNLAMKCEFISMLSTSNSVFHSDEKADSIEIAAWDPNVHSNILSFDASVWSTIAAHYYLFCHIDDHSWARSLYYLSLNRKDGRRLQVTCSKLPRAFKTGSSALYEKYLEYDMTRIVYEILDLQKRYKVQLYPTYLEIYINVDLEDDEFVEFDYDNSGGWSDARDKDLCHNMTKNKIKKIIMEMNNEFHQYDALL